ncbi:MAG: hypothetical protein GY707_03365 [Desulfobacteraceae bacterium]|nr:hypothetical protein [Desulfobacteraceae bacterium]
MSILRIIFSCIMISGILMSCSSLKSEHYVGEKLPIHELLQKESIWQFKDTVFYVRTGGDSHEFVTTATALQWNELKNKYDIKTSKIVLTKLPNKDVDVDDSRFLNLKNDKDDLYTILRLIPANNDKDLIIFTVNDNVIEKHIKEGKVKAVEKSKDFILKLTKEELDNYIKENLNEIFDYSAAGIIQPIKGFKEDD